MSHKPGGRLPLLSVRPAVTLETLKRAATNSAAWWIEAQRVWTVRLRLLPDSVAAAISTQALLRLSPAHQPLGYWATPISTKDTQMFCVYVCVCVFTADGDCSSCGVNGRDSVWRHTPIHSRIRRPDSRHSQHAYHPDQVGGGTDVSSHRGCRLTTTTCFHRWYGRLTEYTAQQLKTSSHIHTTVTLNLYSGKFLRHTAMQSIRSDVINQGWANFFYGGPHWDELNRSWSHKKLI